jgi:hypothetical protein
MKHFFPLGILWIALKRQLYEAQVTTWVRNPLSGNFTTQTFSLDLIPRLDSIRVTRWGEFFGCLLWAAFLKLQK